MSSENINNLTGKQEFRNKSEVFEIDEGEGNISNVTLRIRFGSILRTWADVSKINYFSSIALGEISRGNYSIILISIYMIYAMYNMYIRLRGKSCVFSSKK